MRKQRNTNRRSMFFITFVLILMAGIGTVQITSSYTKNNEKEAEVAVLMAEIEAEKLKYIELNQTINDMSSKAFIEKMARSRFGLIYPDETLIDTREVQ